MESEGAVRRREEGGFVCQFHHGMQCVEGGSAVCGSQVLLGVSIQCYAIQCHVLHFLCIRQASYSIVAGSGSARES